MYIVMAYLVMPCIAMAYIVTTSIVMASIVMPRIVMAYIVYIVMAREMNQGCDHAELRPVGRPLHGPALILGCVSKGAFSGSKHSGHAKLEMPSLHDAKLTRQAYMLTCQAYTPCLHAMLTCHAYMPCLHAKLAMLAYMSSLLAKLTRQAYMPSLRAKLTCQACMPCLHAKLKCQRYMPTLHAKLACLHAKQRPNPAQMKTLLKMVQIRLGYSLR